MPILLELLIYHICFSIPVFMIANKLGNEYAFFAFIPIANSWLLANIAGTDTLGFILLLIPYVGIIAYAWHWWLISDTMAKPAWLGILMMIPVVNIGVAYYVAVS